MNFSDLEKEIVALALMGRNSIQISAVMGISHDEVKNYLETFFSVMPISIGKKGYVFGNAVIAEQKSQQASILEDKYYENKK